MKLLLDTANLEDIKKFGNSTLVAGVTTNPSLMAKEEKGDYFEKLKEIAAVVRAYPGFKHLSVEVTTLDPSQMIDQACQLEEILGKKGNETSVDLHVKIPVMPETMRVLSALRQRGVATNATACMTALQAKFAADAGANIVSFFYNRIIDGQGDANQVLSDFHSMKPHHVKVICGSIRKPEDIQKCWFSGSDYVTAAPAIIEKALLHPQTTLAINKFQEDIEKWLS
jgi:TalC/MipB family fructose-6-phosphate aldolase